MLRAGLQRRKKMELEGQKEVLFPMENVREKLKKVWWTEGRKPSMKSLSWKGSLGQQ